MHRHLVPVLAAAALLAMSGCQISESGSEFRAKENPDSLKPVAEKSINGFETAVHHHQFAQACAHLTEHALRQLLLGPQGQEGHVPRFKDCPLLLAIRTKGSLKAVPRLHVTKVEPVTSRGTTYLVTHTTSPGAGIVMTVDAKRIYSFYGPH